MEKQPIRIALRGASGLLGSRLLAAIARTRDLHVTAGIVRHDSTLERMLARAQFGGPLARKSLPERFYLDEREEVVAELNRRYASRFSFEPLAALSLKDSCDVVIDAAAPGRNHALQAQYQTFPGPVIMQDGEYPRGRLIAPPLIAPAQGSNRYRQGGCVISGVAPVLAAFQDVLSSVRMYLVMQYDGRESDFMITERVNSFRIVREYIPRLEDELGQLFPGVEMRVENVIQIPGMLHYAVTLELTTLGVVSVEEAKTRLTRFPRVRLLPEGVTGTYELNLARAIDDRIPPILVLGSSVISEPCGRGSVLKLTLALYYRTLAVLPNLDAVRMLTGGMEPLEAMRQTDEDVGFEESPDPIGAC